MVLNFSNKRVRAAHRLAVPANCGSMARRLRVVGDGWQLLGDGDSRRFQLYRFDAYFNTNYSAFDGRGFSCVQQKFI
jgi:hypothetical protein